MTVSAGAGAAKPKKPAKKAEHPPYDEMISKAISAANERSGSSRQAIVKHIQANYKVNERAPKLVTLGLKRMVDSHKLIQTKGQGGSGSFKLNKKEKEKKPAAKKTAAAKPKPRAPKDQTDSGKKKTAAKPKSVKAKTEGARKKATTTKPRKPKTPTKAAKSPSKGAAKAATKKPPAKKPAKKPAKTGAPKGKAAKGKKA